MKKYIPNPASVNTIRIIIHHLIYHHAMHHMILSFVLIQYSQDLAEKL